MIMTKGGFDILRKKFGPLSLNFVSGVNALVLASDQAKLEYNEAAYLLATAYHETAGTMQPITEFGSVKYFDKYDTGKLAQALGNTPEKDGDGYKYRGRGYVQITGLDNYKKASKVTGVDLVANPDLALTPTNAAKIAISGMVNGWFTGKKFSHYITKTTKDYVNARRIINGTDKAQLIAGYANIFEQALRSK